MSKICKEDLGKLMTKQIKGMQSPTRVVQSQFRPQSQLNTSSRLLAMKIGNPSSNINQYSTDGNLQNYLKVHDSAQLHSSSSLVDFQVSQDFDLSEEFYTSQTPIRQLSQKLPKFYEIQQKKISPKRLDNKNYHKPEKDKPQLQYMALALKPTQSSVAEKINPPKNLIKTFTQAPKDDKQVKIDIQLNNSPIQRSPSPFEQRRAYTHKIVHQKEPRVITELDKTGIVCIGVEK
ncbi:Hypothetical_protein [Hexamita inflata]|uniref:Hypothetical_protein n=1 Tax=Hexamita inflata TaxID=28002 RepID=A0AA86QTU1_9EUKA|nr:Hypothetical protein HINF_LOCUS47093 [Hexamita inflata]